jgi:hypothetical protein
MRVGVAAVLLAGSVVLIVSACDDYQPNSSHTGCPTCPAGATPTTVTAATAKIISMAILPDIREIKVADTAVFTVQVEMSPGIPPPGPPPSWETDNPAVAKVDQLGGNLTAIAPGQVKLSVHFRGASSTRLLTVIP